MDKDSKRVYRISNWKKEFRGNYLSGQTRSQYYVVCLYNNSICEQILPKVPSSYDTIATPCKCAFFSSQNFNKTIIIKANLDNSFSLHIFAPFYVGCQSPVFKRDECFYRSKSKQMLDTSFNMLWISRLNNFYLVDSCWGGTHCIVSSECDQCCSD